MKRLFALLSITFLTLSLLTACNSSSEKAPEVTQPPAQQAPAVPTPTAAPGKTGKVIESMNAAGYTYVQVDTGVEKFWAAAPETQVKIGDSVVVPEGMPMPNFESKTLNRKFDMVYFVPALLVNGASPAGAPAGAPGAMPPGHPPTTGKAAGMPAMPSSTGAPKVAAPTDIDLKGIKKADQTVADIFTQKAALAGKPVKVRGKVVKYSAGIMGKNWLHIQDGSGQNGSNDLTVNTKAAADVGSTVVVSGNLTVDKDFGYGYKYDVIIEDAQVTKE